MSKKILAQQPERKKSVKDIKKETANSNKGHVKIRKDEKDIISQFFLSG
jgi:hypothetical protein